MWTLASLQGQLRIAFFLAFAEVDIETSIGAKKNKNRSSKPPEAFSMLWTYLTKRNKIKGRWSPWIYENSKVYFYFFRRVYQHKEVYDWA